MSEKNKPLDESALEKSSSKETRHSGSQENVLTKPVPWLRRHWRMITRISTVAVTLATGIWAIFTFIFPTVILPRI